MSEKPIIFNGAMVNAILAGTKTQTRRIMKSQPEDRLPPFYICTPPRPKITAAEVSQYLVGDILYVRETIRPIYMEDMADGVEYRADGAQRVADVERLAEGCGHYKRNLAFNWNAGIEEGWDEKTQTNNQKWIPAIHMPKWAARLWLEVTTIRVQKLMTINDSDAKAEGFPNRTSFFDTWEKLYGPESLKADPWVWVIEFKRTERR